MLHNTDQPMEASIDWLGSNGEMAERIRKFDWSRTPLGPATDWSSALRTTVGLMLANRFPMLLWWGPDYISIYNDAYIPILGRKHPHALGLPVRECWSEIWDILKPLIDTPFNGGPSTWIEDFELYVQRSGFNEETHFTVAYSPVPDAAAAGGVGGVLAHAHEISEKVVAERRVAILHDLGVETGESTAGKTCRVAAQALACHGKDVPFALLYLIDPDGKCAQLAGAAGIEPGKIASPLSVSLDPAAAGQPWPLAEAFRSQQIVSVTDLASRFDSEPDGLGGESPHTALFVPLHSNKARELFGFLVGGVSPRLKFDEQYRSFYELAGSQIANAIAKARAYEEERRRAEALAEIDRAKTAFFSNVSHEFRTPLTLMLGPLEELRREFGMAESPLSLAQYQQIDLVHRNGLRLLKLVNTLLDFSRIEAGRVQALYEPVDLAAFTAELAGVFRSAVETAGLTLSVECLPLTEPVFVDREMWEKIVLNLLSNAFKFTFTGGIELAMRQTATHAELTVRDSGTGIPADELPRIFERFHRVAGARGRSHEGSGIGLALVQELVHLHAGSVTVESTYGTGSAFHVALPLGSSHLPQEHVGIERKQRSTALGARPFIEEALRWLPGCPAEEFFLDSIVSAEDREKQSGPRPRVLLAEDNADMREYLCRLLAARFDVEAVADGAAALAAVRESQPDLVLTDIMMPRLDGIQLLAKLRSDPLTSTIPIILLSARAGEESRVGGMQAGADDYLIKPFSASELLARVEGHIKMSHFRRETEQALKESKQLLSAELAAMTRMQQVSTRLVQAGNISTLLDEMLDAAIELSHADMGNIQLLENGALRIVAQRGFETPFVDFFETIREGVAACGAALQRGERIIVEDVAASEIFAATAALPVMRAADVRAVQSTPLVTRAGQILGMLSTHYRSPRRPDDHELRLLDVLARQAADILERRRAEETQQFLVAELNHRVKNTLASVQAIAHQMLRRTRDPVEFAAGFSGRIQSLARVHTMLSTTSWQSVDLRQLIRDQLLAGAVDETRLIAWGPPVHLEAQQALHMALMLHELGTNAIKYGALSAAKGTVTVSWSVDDAVLRLRWEERGGPAVPAPARRGFGRTLIEQSARGAGGDAQMAIEAGGVVWTISVLLPEHHQPATLLPAEPVGRPVVEESTQVPKGAARLAGKRLLVIEDEPLVALDIAAALETAGAEVIGPAGTATEALNLINSTKPDAALLDANLRGQSAGEIAARLTARNVPFIFVTGYGADSLPQAFAKAPILSKPFSHEQLVAAAVALGKPSAQVVRFSG